MIPIGGTLAITIDTSACEGSDEEIKKLEHVTLTISFQHRRRGDVSIDLFSPSGTRNEMLSTRRYIRLKFRSIFTQKLNEISEVIFIIKDSFTLC